MRGLIGSVVLGAGLLLGCGPGPEVEAEAATRAQPLTTTDVDVPPECQGVLTFVNTASFTTLDVYLPSDTATNIVGARPYATLAALSAVNGVGATRLTQIHQGALTEGFITSSCVGIFDELAISADDAAAIVAFVNTASDTELHDVMPNAWNGALNLLAGRPYTTVQAIANTSGVGAVSVRNLRNAATLSRPFEELAAAVNALHMEARLARHFDWWQEMRTASSAYHLGGMTCFGIDPQYLPQGTDIRPNLATASEVYSRVAYTVQYANRRNGLTIDPNVGLSNLQTQLQGRSFFGCEIQYADDPWSGNTLTFYVDPVSGLSVLAETWWVE
ncbi:MAG: hypothetical protein ACOZQL_24455 [Myxococcota bacterium]